MLVNRYIDDEVDKIPRIAAHHRAASRPNGMNFLIIGSDTRAFVDNAKPTSEAFSDKRHRQRPRRAPTR